MDASYENILSISLSNDEIELFQNILDKLTEKSIGFNVNSLTEEEIEFLDSLKSNL